MLGDLNVYIPVLVLGLIGHLRCTRRGQPTLAAALAITA